MDLEEQINKVLFEIGQDIKIHKIDSENSVIEIDYTKYTAKILRIILNYLNE
jgi:hypothetical protein